MKTLDEIRNEKQTKSYLLIFLIFGFLIVAGVFVYFIYDGKLDLVANLVCGNLSVSCQQCQDCPSIPSCPACPSLIFPNELNMRVNNSC